MFHANAIGKEPQFTVAYKIIVEMGPRDHHQSFYPGPL